MIRPIREEDFLRYSELASQLGYPVKAEYAREELRKQLQRPWEKTLVFDQPGVGVVGTVACRIVEPAYRPPYGEIVGLVIDDAYRSRGYGAELLAVAEDWIREHGATEVIVRSNSTRTEAHRFYDREGFSRYKTQVVFRKLLSD